MKLSKYLSLYIYIMVIILALSGAFLISSQNAKPTLFVSKQQSTLNINENFWMYFNLGQKRLISSFYWVGTILDSDVDHYKKKDLNSWMFIRFNTISLLEPKFYENYKFGGPYLSIIKDDLSGADIIYDKGLRQYPDDYSLLLNSGFHYYFEQKDLNKAYPILNKLKNKPEAPQYMISALARIESNRGNLMDSFLILKEYQTRFKPESPIWKKINEQLYSLKAEIDLNCLNNNQKNCSKIDFDGVPYKVLNLKYQASKTWIPYRPKWVYK
ncbi:hypothetical protein SHI21_00515 [Bacteriovorax sp. PP10]|uniref:Tetratricopeptide repeat protein n=1 Tax=Bacteriovorax antarcticus TaxID=3088717 RepID=A0ABU5VRK9_9BACT|nr:hypothetical protein [Bacteriovorax sp. PP10]MEA9354665.1 hypothetical protein [Bacteriovorax sp. PP10]